MTIGYINKPHYVLFSSLNYGDVFCTQEKGGYTHIWIKRETWTNTDSESFDEGESANAFGLDNSTDFHLFKNDDVVIFPTNVHLNIEF